MSALILPELAPQTPVLDSSARIAPPPIRPGENDYLITHYRTLVRTLHDIHTRRCELHIRLEHEGRVQVFHSSIQKIDEDAQLLVLHQLQPANWRELISRPMSVEISCFLPSGLLRFVSQIAPLAFDEGEEGAEDDTHFCTLKLPSKMIKTQQRSSYRVPLLNQNIRAELHTMEGPLFGKAVDFSVEGCCCQFSADLVELMEEEAALYRVRFLLGRKLEVLSDAVICRIRELPKYRVLVGLRFVSLDPALKRQLQTALLAIERQQLRRHAIISGEPGS